MERLPHRGFGGLRILIAGGGIGGVETMLALRALAGGLVEIELLSVEHELWYRPLATAEPFGAGRVHRLELAGLAARAGASFTPGELAAVDPVRHRVRTTRGLELPYDVLVLACGALPRAAVPGALTFRGPADAEGFRRLLDELEEQPRTALTFVQPPGATWSLPLYELALQTRVRLDRRRAAHVEIAFVTHEPAPLAVFGPAASDAVAALLAERRIRLHAGGSAAPHPSGRVVALPRLEAQAIAGIPGDADGFVATDEYGAIRGLGDVFAVGDITSFPVKQGGIAAQQADAAAETIAGRAGAALAPQPFSPVLHAVLLTGRTPLYLRAELDAAGDTTASTVSSAPPGRPAQKVAARYLAPVLASRRVTSAERRPFAASAAERAAPPRTPPAASSYADRSRSKNDR